MGLNTILVVFLGLNFIETVFNQVFACLLFLIYLSLKKFITINRLDKQKQEQELNFNTTSVFFSVFFQDRDKIEDTIVVIENKKDFELKDNNRFSRFLFLLILLL